jgi:tRNA A37 threonylcarbamoyladenosine biosynthesis protein TsaE
MSDKSLILFTNFWDANAIVGDGFFLFSEEDKIYRANLDSFSVHSISLSSPDITGLRNIQKIGMPRIDAFCPTYDMLKRYKNDNNWNAYKKDFYNLMKQRKSRLVEWLSSLKSNHIYILCCWENTSGGANCHRTILYTMIKDSKIAQNKVMSLYRHGNESGKKKEDKMLIAGPWGDLEGPNANRNIYISSFLGAIPIRQDITVIPADMQRTQPPRNR